MTKIQELETKREQLEEEFSRRMRELEIEIGKLQLASDKSAPKPIKWMPEIGQPYYFVNGTGICDSCAWRGDRVDLYRQKHIGIFKTSEDCYRWHRIDAVIRAACGEAVERDELFRIERYNDCFMAYPASWFDPCSRYWTNNPDAADEINAALTEDDRRWFLAGGRG